MSEKYNKDSLGNRMKSNYEGVYKIKLPNRLPIIIRIDGKAFSKWTKSCQRPFDDKLINAMDKVAITLCSEIQGAVLGYVASDEISILIHNYKSLDSSAYFDNQIQKIVSVSAGIASSVMTEESINVFGKLKRAVFDARVFVLPEAEVNNYFVWRQNDYIRNSVSMLARSLLSHKECDFKNNLQLKELIINKGKDWNSLPINYRYGRCIEKVSETVLINKKEITRNSWTINNNIPKFSENSNYIEKLLKTNE